MANTYFAFKQFTVYHDRCAMKVGTDGVLLGAWVSVQNANSILDVGTGTGLIAIMCAQRSKASIDAVEIDNNAYGQAVENVYACPWKERIKIHHDSFQHFATKTASRYNMVVSNPPYFRHSLKPPAKSRSLARHDDNLNFESILFYTAQILAPEGRLAIIIPAKEIDHFTELAYFHDLHPQRQTLVRPHMGKDYSRCLAEYSRNKSQLCITNELIIKQENTVEYTNDFKTIVREFYLKV
jgi:tRNA1Val (adenine37-N6)-methyltransferase